MLDISSRNLATANLGVVDSEFQVFGKDDFVMYSKIMYYIAFGRGNSFFTPLATIGICGLFLV